jgi:hypothetical protein
VAAGLAGRGDHGAAVAGAALGSDVTQVSKFVVDAAECGAHEGVLVGTGTWALSGFGHQRDDRVDVVALHWVVSEPVRTDEAAHDAPVDQHEPFTAAVLGAFGAHHAPAGRGPVAGVDVDVLGVQARRAVVAVAPVA